MFTADVVPFAMGTGMGYYSVYNLTVLSAEKGTFQDWQPTLNKVLSSLNYTPEFQSFAMSQSNQAASTSQSLSQSASEMSDSIMSSWENRNRSQDIMSQKQSDSTLGYERIVDTETGNIYKIDNGFTDWYDGSRYKSITDDLKAFVKGVRGYFSYYLRRFSLCFCLNNAFQPVLRSQTATMVKKHFDFIICFALLNHKNSIRFVFLRMVIWGG